MLRRPNALFCLLVVALVGCGGGGEEREVAQRIEVTGKVTLDGEPMKEGSISFSSPEDVAAGEAPGIGQITDGTYTLKATPGKKQVKVSLLKEAGEKDATGVAPQKETIPAKFNTKTTLEAEVTEAGPNAFDFEVMSK